MDKVDTKAKKSQILEISNHTNRLPQGWGNSVTTTVSVMANIQSAFSEIQDSDVTVLDLFDEIKDWTCPFFWAYKMQKFRGRTSWKLYILEFKATGRQNRWR